MAAGLVEEGRCVVEIDEVVEMSWLQCGWRCGGDGVVVEMLLWWWRWRGCSSVVEEMLFV